ncbi:MAG: hypothetical protein IT204_00895 [Fimbriimonadaceae bacterium]|nr:hypothetical protein [Fimbriimonadaceae bacterium]
MNVRRLMVPVLAITMFVLIFLYFRGPGGGGGKADDKAKPPPTKKATVAARAIAQGGRVGLDDIKEEDIPEADFANRVPAEAYTDTKFIIGGQARVALAPGDAFTPTNIDPPPQQASQSVQPGFVAVTIAAPPQPSLYDLSFLKPDDRVDAFGVNFDQNAGQSVSVRLASNVRVVAVDKILSQQQEDKRKADLQKEIKAKQDERAAEASKTPPPTADALKTRFDDPIAKLQEQLEPKIENPSVTIEVTPAQAQYLTLWRKTAEIQLALHRAEDAQQIIFDNAQAYLAGAGGEAGGPGGPPLLTLDDVVPLDRRDVVKYNERQRQSEQDREAAEQRKLDALERDVRMTEMRVEKRNLERYGSRMKPPATTPAPAGPAVPPVSVMQSNTAQVKALQDEVRRLRGDVKTARPATATPPRPGRGTIEVYRGKEKSVVSY